jgi:hypothetical protein
MALGNLEALLTFRLRERNLVYRGNKPDTVCDCVQTVTVGGVAFVYGRSYDCMASAMLTAQTCNSLSGDMKWHSGTIMSAILMLTGVD